MVEFINVICRPAVEKLEGLIKLVLSDSVEGKRNFIPGICRQLKVLGFFIFNVHEFWKNDVQAQHKCDKKFNNFLLQKNL